MITCVRSPIMLRRGITISTQLVIALVPTIALPNETMTNEVAGNEQDDVFNTDQANDLTSTPTGDQQQDNTQPHPPPTTISLSQSFSIRTMALTLSIAGLNGQSNYVKSNVTTDSTGSTPSQSSTTSSSNQQLNVNMTVHQPITSMEMLGLNPDWEDLVSHFQCPCCRDVLAAPLIFQCSCQQSFCWKCIQHWGAGTCMVCGDQVENHAAVFERHFDEVIAAQVHIVMANDMDSNDFLNWHQKRNAYTNSAEHSVTTSEDTSERFDNMEEEENNEVYSPLIISVAVGIVLFASLGLLLSTSNHSRKRNRK